MHFLMAFADAKSIVCPLGGVKLTTVELSLSKVLNLSFLNFTSQLAFMGDKDPIFTSDSQN